MVNVEENFVRSSFLGENDRHFADDVLRCNYMNEKFCILINITVKFVPKRPIDNNPAFIAIITQHWIMAWCQINNSQLSGQMLTRYTDAYRRHKGR